MIIDDIYNLLSTMGWLRLAGSLILQVSFAKEPYKRDDILQKRPIILRSLLIVATPYLSLLMLMITMNYFGLQRREVGAERGQLHKQSFTTTIIDDDNHFFQ